MIPASTIEKIISVANIEDVVSDYVSLKKRGANLIGLCPFHTEKTPSFSVSPTKGIYKCFGCGKSGHAINFIMEIEQCSFLDAVRQLANKYHIEIIEKEQSPEEIQRHDDKESMAVVNDFAQKWFKQQLWETDEGKSVALQYLYTRGITDEMINLFQLGYNPNKFDALAKILLQNGFKKEYIINDPDSLKGTGLCYEKNNNELVDRFRDRVIFPVHSVSGKIVAFVGRIMIKKENTGKYINSPDSLLYSKSNELFGLFQTKQFIAKSDLCYLVEGQMDVLSLYQAGIKNVVASGGTALTQKQIQLLHRFTSNITVLYDGDSAGIHAATRGLDMLLEYACNVKIVLLPDGEDPDSLAHKLSHEDLLQYLTTNSTDFIQFKINLVNQSSTSSLDPIEKSKLIKDIINSIAYIPDRIIREVYIQATAQKLNINENVLLKEVINLRKQKYAAINSTTKQPQRNEPNSPQNTIQKTDDDTNLQKNEQRTNKLNLHFKNLLQIIIKYGHVPLFNTQGTENVIYAGHFIIRQLKQDNINIPSPLMQEIIDEYEKHYLDENFNATNYFKFHNNIAISELAIELTTDKYITSEFFTQQVITENIVVENTESNEETHLNDIVPHLLLELKETIIEQKIDDIQQSIKQAQQNEQSDELQTLLEELIQYIDIKKQICKQLGNRIITK